MFKLLLLIVSTLSLATCKKDSDNLDYKEAILYLANNNSIIDTSQVYNEGEFAILNSDLEKFQIFLLGESHAVRFNEIIDVKLLKNLYYNSNVRYYLQESSYSNSSMINKYVQTGDISHLDYLYKQLQGTMECNQDSYDKWKKIYEFNSTLPEDQKLTVIGADVEHQVNVAYYFLNSLLPQVDPILEIKDMIDKIKNYQQLSTINAKYETGCQIYSDVLAKEDIYKDYLKENYFEFRFVLSNINKTTKYKFPVQNDSIREAAIYENFLELSQHFPDGNYYGKWGREHVIQNYSKTKYAGINDSRFAISLNSDTSAFKSKVLTIISVYIDCNYLSSYKGYHVESLSDEYSDKQLINMNSSNLQLFKLNGEESPFQDNLYFLSNGRSNSTIDYFQYVLKIKNSPASNIYQ